ncbi:MAG: MotA/TolQ/ExbB proton channel family protein [bacterium]|nr:MotA/TolQ/ExbB proton channel family protein [bacterium]
MIYKGGPLVAGLAFLLVLVVAFAIERFWIMTLTKGKIGSEKFLVMINDKLLADDLDGLEKDCDNQKGSLGRVIQAGLNRYKLLSGSVSQEGLKAELQLATKEAQAMEGAIMERNMIPIATIGSIATMMGLLGTVIGMIRSFSAISASGEETKVASTQLAQGIAEALVNTAGGLGVAIVAIISYNYFLSRIDKMNFMMEESSSELISLLLIREKK